jgi:hypothetical protein
VLPSSIAPNAAATATVSATRAPKIARDSTQRPSPSVPSGKALLPSVIHIGGASMCNRSCSSGSCGAIHGAKIASPATATRIPPPIQTRGWRASWRSAGPMPVACTVRGSEAALSPIALMDASSAD